MPNESRTTSLQRGRDVSPVCGTARDMGNWRTLAMDAGCSAGEAEEWAAIASQKLRYPADSHVLLEEILVHLEERAQTRQRVRLALVQHHTPEPPSPSAAFA